MESQRLDNFVGVWMGIDRKVMNRYNWKSNGPGGCDDHNIEHPCGPCITGKSKPEKHLTKIELGRILRLWASKILKQETRN